MGVVGLRSSLFYSALIHLLLIAVWVAVFDRQATHEDQKKKLTWIEVDPLPDQKDSSRRIVQTSPSQKTDTAAPDALLGKQTQKVDRQTVSKFQKSIDAQEKRVAKSTSKGKSENKQSVSMGHLALKMIPKSHTGQRQEDLDRERMAPELRSPTGVPQDYVKGLKESERTALNTKEYVFFGYFQRIRRRLDLAWTGLLRHHLLKYYRMGRQLASDMDHTTRILVTLNQRGEIIRVQVLEESGTRDLDEAAIQAFNKAGPFPNPPKGIIDNNGLVHIRWDFVLRT